MSVSYWQDNSKNSKLIECDVLVIGAGVAGVSAAYWLKQEDPELRVAIVDKGAIGSGATGRNAGFITCGSVEHFNRLVTGHGEQKALEIWQYSEKNLELLKEHIIQKDETKIDFEHKGSFSLASTQDEFAELKQSAALMEKLKIEVEVLDEPAIKSRLGADQFVGGIKYIKDASVHPLKLLHLIKDKLKGVELIEHNEVHRIDSRGESKVVHTRNHQIETSMVVLATNGYSADLQKYFADKIFPTRGQILVTEPVERFMEGPCYANFVLDYFRQLTTGELIIGGFRQLEKETEVGYSDHTTEKIQLALGEFIQKHIPKLKNKKITHRWGGIMGFSADGQPMVGSLPTDSSIFFTGGFTAHGLGLAFHTGKVLVDAMFGRDIPEFVSAKRF